MYDESDYLLISGIQHFLFCRRQWALIHIEQQWQENILTYEGRQFHERADDEKFHEKRGDKLIIRALRVHSATLGLTGRCDIVEFTKSEKGAYLHKYKDIYEPAAVEYKHGRKKYDDSDVYQLLGETLCLEEMLSCEINHGYLYYFETKQRVQIDFTTDTKRDFNEKVSEMHQYWTKRYTPRVKPTAKCKRCSLESICLPKMLATQTVDQYLKGALDQ
ncbi:CRISPR-associated protein Cas4 [Agrilactobacillus yilanensis]|uniref:CRISPR-associated exonuclease Cas4 n=1 Tax=Agrilactobacillus yilanensis TaxID=2485997 RepID=A0ABW4J4U2_9LACO|nr:CRISPR-associated protein Cas4 [Agrilactobacillus yilanensis]